MKAQELRIGNIVEYLIRDEMDAKKEWWEPSQIDAQDILWLSQNPDDEDYRPIPLTEEWLVRLGFESNPYQDRYENKVIHVQCNKTKGYTELWIERMPHIKHVHQLQNLFYCLCGEELTTTPIQ